MSKFKRPPLTPKEREQLADNFIDSAARTTPSEKRSEKEKRGVIFLRVPQALIDDLDRIHKLTGYKPNTYCLHIIIEAVREKLKQIERESG